MNWLNYHHLLYFWSVVQHGSVSAAARALKLRQPTVSAQIRSLESSLGHRLFRKSGRNLVLTEHGRIAMRYAQQIFESGQEMLDVLNDRLPSGAVKLMIGIADAMPKHVAHKLLSPAYTLPEQHVLVCEEDRPERLLARLALHELDLVLSDSPIPPQVDVKAFHHLLGESPVALFGTRKFAKQIGRRPTPSKLRGAPVLLPTRNSALRRQLELWFEEHDLQPRIRGEFQDSALLKIFGHAGHGLFPAPLHIASELRGELGVVPILELAGLSERFYAISLARQIRHPSILAICNAAKRTF